MPFLRTVLATLGCAVIAIGVAVWAGWTFQVIPLTTFAGAGTPMGINAAASMIAAGIGFLAVLSGSTRVARSTAGVVAFLGVASLLQTFSRNDWGIDRWLWLQASSITMAPPAMPIFTACGLIVVALTLTMLSGRKPWLGVGTTLGGVLLLMALLGLFSFLIALHSSQEWSSYHGIGLPTACSLTLLGLGLLVWIGTQRGELGVTACLIAAAIALGMAIGATTRQSLSEFRESNTWVARTLEAEVSIAQLAGGLARLDASTRSFALTGGAEFAAQAEAEKTEVRQQLAALAVLLQKHPEQQRRLRDAGPLVEQIVRENETMARTRQEQGGDASALRAEIGATKSARAVTALIGELRAGEERRRIQAFQDIRQTESNTRMLQALGGSVTALLIGLAFWLAWRAVSIRQAAEAALTEARDQALEHSRLKSEFLANMSHEIRTPMNGVIGMTSLLAETSISPEQREYVETIRVCGESLLILISDILDFSKIESGRIDLEEHEFDIVTCIDETLVLFKAKAREKKIELSYSVDPSVPRVVVGDVTRVRQVVANLVSNAIKFTQAGEIEVSMKRMDSPASASCLLAIRVRDTGIGIPEGKRHRLFQPFSQVEASTNRRFGGTGLGLSISRRLCELMGGTMTVESAEGRGSTFQFTIRVGVAATRHSISSAPVAVSDSVDFDELPSFKILLAEDNSTNQLVAQRMLMKLGYRGDTAANGEEVIEALGRQPYDIILMDVQMPVIDGIEATERLRRDPTLKQPWIIAMTANAMTGDRERCLAAGMNDYVSKPVKLEELRNAFSRAAFNLVENAQG